MNLKNKNILFFAPVFFGYEKKMKEKMEELGAIVDFYDERSVSKPLEKKLMRIAPKIFDKKTDAYYNRIIEENTEKKYDYVLFIKCESASESQLALLKKKYTKAKFILYLYDSVENIRGIDKKFVYFDKVLSFDPRDSEKFDCMKFRPLFYLDCYRKNKIKENYIYDLCFIGTVHSDRYNILNRVRNYCKNNNRSFYLYMFIQNKWVFIINKYITKSFRKSELNEFKLDKLSSDEISEIINNSNIIVDIQHPKQKGLTMRTIEIIGMNKKLITTNSEIVNYDFYNENNILVIQRDEFAIPQQFIDMKYEAINEETYEKYSIGSWVRDLFDFVN
ncbi:MAG: hypothetical protein K0R15_784 [Clostridiales bacterium]|jgi:hypothetical protein|nr:hypothetical protein [Clostridiales bacterium]